MERLLRVMRYYHGAMMIVWPLLAIPTLLWWKDAVLWVALLSLYANFASEFGAWHASRTEKKQDEMEQDQG